MAITVVRNNSDTPNISNQDDVRMFRLACGDNEGYVRGYLN